MFEPELEITISHSHIRHAYTFAEYYNGVLLSKMA